MDAFSDVFYKASRFAQDATGNATEDALTETLDTPMQGNLLRGIHKKTVWREEVNNLLGVDHKLRLQDKVVRWSKNVHFFLTFIENVNAGG